jgi:hypothetical protein
MTAKVRKSAVPSGEATMTVDMSLLDGDSRGRRGALHASQQQAVHVPRAARATLHHS